MPTLTSTIEDSSPVIVYSQSDGYDDWKAGTSKTDQNLDSYSDTSYTASNLTGASVSFSFYGTGVQLVGAKRQNHGIYQISIDSIVYPQVNGGINDTQGQFGATLFTTVALAAGYHTVKMTNLGGGVLDLDYLTWQTPIGEVNDQLKTITLQDTDSAFTYSPAVNWFNTPQNLGLFSGGTGHATSTAGSYLELKFKGEAITLYGPITPNGATYSVSLDGAAPTNYSSATRSIYRPQQMLYQVSNLNNQGHTLKIQSEAWGQSGSEFIVDYAMVYTTSALESSRPVLSKGGIIGVAVGGFFGLVLIALIAFFCLRFCSRYRKYKRATMESESNVAGIDQPFEQRPASFIGTATSHTGLLPATSHGSLHSRAQYTPGVSNYSTSPPATATTWSPPPGTHIIYSATSEPIIAGPNTQVITVPFTPEGKYRPDLQTPIRAPSPSISHSVENSTSYHLDQVPPLPAGAQPPLSYVVEEPRRMGSVESR